VKAQPKGVSALWESSSQILPSMVVKRRPVDGLVGENSEVPSTPYAPLPLLPSAPDLHPASSPAGPTSNNRQTLTPSSYRSHLMAAQPP